MKTVDLSKVEAINIDGTIQVIDGLSQELAQAIYRSTQDLEEHIFAERLYKNPKIEVNETNKRIVLKYAERHLPVYILIAIREMLKDTDNENT